MAKANSGSAPPVELAPANPPAMGRGAQSSITDEVCRVWVEALNDSEKFPKGVQEPGTGYKSRGAAQSKAQKLKKRITEYAELDTSTTRIRIRIWKPEGSSEFVFALQLVPVTADDSAGEDEGSDDSGESADS